MLKKSVLLASAAAAAAAGFAVPVSAAEVKAAAYADLRYGFDYFDDRNSAANPSDTSFVNLGSYYGFKGSAEQGGIVAFGAYERWLDAEGNIGIDLARQGYAGVKTGYGTLQFGTFGTAYMESGRKLDPFYATGAAGTGNPNGAPPTGRVLGGQSHGMSTLTADAPSLVTAGLVGGFVKNQLQYTTPSIMGLTVNAGVAFDESPNGNSDDYSAGVEYNGMGITAGLQYLDSNSADPTTFLSNYGLGRGDEAYRLYAAYNQQRWGASVSGERIDSNAAAAPNADYLMASGWFGVMPGTRLAASYGMENEAVDLTSGISEEGTSFRLGLFYDVLDNFTTHVVYRNFDAKSSDTYGTVPDDQVLELGATFKFELSGTTNTR